MKKILSVMLAIVTLASTPIAAFADDDSECRVKIKAIMPQAWLDKGNYEFDITFVGNDSKEYAFLDEDNGFEDEITLQKLTPYTVIFSDEVTEYEIGGIDTDLFLVDSDSETIILSFKRQGTVAETQDGTITKTQADQLAEAREVVQSFIENVEPLGINDNLGNEKLVGAIGMEEVDEEMLIGMNNTIIYDSFHGGKSGKYYTEDVYESLSEKERFYCRYLSVAPFSSIDFSAHSWKTSDAEFSLRRLSYFPEIEEEVATVWEWLYEQGQATGSMPDLFEVYMDMKNGVEYEIENTDETTSEIMGNESSDNEIMEVMEDASKADTDVPSEDEDPEEPAEIDQTENDTAPKREIKTVSNAKEQKGFGDILKDNIITIILAVALVAALIAVIKLMKDKKKAENNKT